MAYKISSTYEYILNTDSLGNNIQPPFLADVKAGDVLIMMWNQNDDDKITIDDGWSEIPNTDPKDTSLEVRAYYHVATSDGEQCSSYSNTFAGYLYMHTMCIRVDGAWEFVDSGAIKQKSASNTNIDYPALEATAAGQLVFYLGGSDADNIQEGVHPDKRQISGVYDVNDSVAYEYVTTGAGTIPAFQDHVDSDQTTALGFIIGDEGGLPPLDIQPVKALAPITDITHNTQWMEDIYASGYDIDTGEPRVPLNVTLTAYTGTTYVIRVDQASSLSGCVDGDTVTFGSGNTATFRSYRQYQSSSGGKGYITISDYTGSGESDNETVECNGNTALCYGSGAAYQINVTGLIKSSEKLADYKSYKVNGYEAIGLTDGSVYWVRDTSNADSENEGYWYTFTSHAHKYEAGTTVTPTGGGAITGTLNNYGMCHYEHNIDADNDYPATPKEPSGYTGWKKALVGSVKTFDSPKDMRDELMAVWTKPTGVSTAYMYVLAIDTSNRWKLWKIRSKYISGYIATAIYHNLISMSSVDTPMFQVPGFDATAVKKYGIMFRLSSDTQRNGCSTYGQSLIQKQTITGGGEGKQVTFSDIATMLSSEVSAEGIAYTESLTNNADAQFVLSRDLVLSCNIHMDTQSLITPLQADGVSTFLSNVDGGKVGIETNNANGQITTSLISTSKGGYWKSGTGDSIEYNGTTLGKFDVSLVSGKTYTGVTYTGCSQILQNGATLNNCNIKNTTSSQGAILLNGTITGGSITDNLYGIEIASAGTYTLNDISFSNNTKDINVTATTGTVTIVTNVAGITCITAGATVDLQAPETTYTMKDIPVGAEYRLYVKDPLEGVIGTIGT